MQKKTTLSIIAAIMVLIAVAAYVVMNFRGVGNTDQKTINSLPSENPLLDEKENDKTIDTVVPASNQETDLTHEQQQRLQAIQSLNYVILSLTHIINYNDKVVLDQEYDNIINNLNLRSIPDEEIVLLLQDLLDLLTKSKITDTEREIIERKYERNVNNALKDAFKSGLSGTQFTANPYTTLASGLMNAGAVYFNYRSQVEQYQEDLKDQNWEIDKNILVNLNDFRMGLLKSSWHLLKDYDIPDLWRLTEEQLTNYSNILRDPDVKKRHARLKRIEKEFQMYPPYWYYRGRAAQDIEDKDDAVYCYEHFNTTRMPIYRKDPFAASIAMSRIMLDGDKAPETQILAYLQQLVENSADKDWANLLFAALQYARLGRADDARELIMRNLDNGYAATFGTTEVFDTLMPTLINNADSSELEKMMKGILQADTVSNYDILRLIGKMNNKDILSHLAGEFSDIFLFPVPYKSRIPGRKLFNNDGLSLVLPARWATDNLGAEIRATVADETEVSVKPDITGFDGETKNVSVFFANIFNINDAVENQTNPNISITLLRDKLLRDRTDEPTYEITLKFTSHVVTAAEAKSWADSFLKQSVTTTLLPSLNLFLWFLDEEDDQRGLIFKKSAVVFDGETYEWTDEGLVLP